jgi:hypothetical protein
MCRPQSHDTSDEVRRENRRDTRRAPAPVEAHQNRRPQLERLDKVQHIPADRSLVPRPGRRVRDEAGRTEPTQVRRQHARTFGRERGRGHLEAIRV